MQDKRSVIIKAKGEAKSIQLVGNAVKKNPGFLELRHLEAAKQISETLSKSKNTIYLDSGALLMNLETIFDKKNN